ncbi:MAG: SDR family oxidoreductase [Bacteroidetes bacterium]|nr:SDR family oxidoreductase [Bacteroidota bacterium]
MFDKKLLYKKVVLITGGGTGLGRSMALAMGKHGATVVIASRKSEVLESTKADFEQEGIDCRILTCDVRDILSVEEMVAKVVEECGHLDILVNNAAGNFISPTEYLSAKGFDVIVDIVLKGTFYVTHTVGSYWIKNKIPGTVLNITTTYADSGSGYVVPSACGKAGVNALTRSLAVEWAKYGIRMNAIAPGPIPTEGAFSRLMPGADWEEKIKNRVPMKRFGTHDELSNLALFLVSDLSSFINGEVINMDGGEQIKGAGQFNDLDQIPAEVWPELAKKMRKGQK